MPDKPRIAAVQERIDRHDVTLRSMGEPNSMRAQFDFSGSPAIAAFLASSRRESWQTAQPSNRPTGSSAAGTWRSRWVSTPPVTARAASSADAARPS